MRRNDLQFPGLLTLSVLIAAALVRPAMLCAQPDEDERKDIDTPGLQVEALVGWDDVVDKNTPLPVSFLITNRSEELIEGELVIRDLMMGHEAVLEEVYVAPGTSRRVSAIRDLRNWYDCEARLVKGDRTFWRRELPLSTGNEFFPNINYVLFVDSAGRKVQLPGELSDTLGMAASNFAVAGANGRSVKSLSIRPWQIPNHHGPLTVIQAMILQDGLAKDVLSRVQLEAIAEWICQGGTLFVHGESEELLNRLQKESPLNARTVEKVGEFTVHRLGAGAIFEYGPRLLSSESVPTRAAISTTIARLSRTNINQLLTRAYTHGSRAGRADRNRILIVAFFLLYAFLSGVVAIFLFRLSQRKIGAYTLVVVVAASVMAGGLGGILRYSEGDLDWITITEIGPGGAVQVAQINVQSAGSRNNRVTIKGENPDLQFVGRTRRYYYRWNQERLGWAPFTWQRNLATDDDASEVLVPMTPWGQRQLHATAYRQDVQPFDFTLGFEKPAPPAAAPGQIPPADQAAMEEEDPLIVLESSDAMPESSIEAAAAVPAVPNGTFTLKFRNHLPVDLNNCWLIIGVTQGSPQSMAAIQANPVPAATLPQSVTGTGPRGLTGQAAPLQIPPATAAAPTGLVDVYHIMHIPVIPAGASHEQQFDAEFKQINNDWELHRSWPNGTLTLPRLSQLGTASAWLVGNVKNSPVIEIDEDRSEFVASEGVHLIVQQIKPHDMPAASEFMPPLNPAANATENADTAPDKDASDESQEVPPGGEAGDAGATPSD